MPIDPKININENQVIFKRDVGHNHDGLTSRLIDYTKYSMSDFVVYPIAPPNTPRRSMQQKNLENLETFVVNAVERRVLNPTGIRLQANVISAREIISGTITANELSANIILVDNVIKSKNYNGAINSDGIITARGNAGWAITHNGEAEFNNVNIRGNLIAGAGSYESSNTQIFANTGGFFSLGSNFAWNGSSLTIRGNITLSNTNVGTFDNGDALTGGSIGGITIGPSYIASTDYDGSNGFAIYSNGFADFNEVNVRGYIEALSGNIGGILSNSDTLSSSNYSVNPSNQYDITGFALFSNGSVRFGSATIGNSVRIGNNVRVNNATADGSQTVFKVRGDTNADSNFMAKFQKLNGDEVLTIRDDGRVGIAGSLVLNGVTVSPSSYVTGGPYLPTAGGTLTGGLTANASVTVNDQVFISASLGTTETDPALRVNRSYDQDGGYFIEFTNTAGTVQAGRIRYTLGNSQSVAYLAGSDSRLKNKIIKNIDGISVINNLNPTHYEWINTPGRECFGFIAQELHSVIPDAVSPGDNEDIFYLEDGRVNVKEPWAIEMSGIVPYLVKAVQELSNKIDILEAKGV
jgi:hypothetical protein